MAQLAAQILTHMLRNPQVVDSLEGLTRFRLLEQRIQQGVAETTEALRWLVKTGLVLEESTSEGHRVYRVNPARINEAVKFGRELRREDS